MLSQIKISKIKKNLKFLFIFFLFSFIFMFLGELVGLINALFQSFTQSIYALIWSLIPLTIILFKLKSFIAEINWNFVVIIILGLLLNLVSIFLNASLGAGNILEKNYVATYGISDKYDSRNEDLVTFQNNTFVFKKDDLEIEQELVRLEELNGESNYKEFIFWQTAYSLGYKPKNIWEYSSSSSISKKLSLFLTVGPIFLIESLINAIFGALNFFILPIIGLIFKKRIFEKQLRPLHDMIF